MNSKKATAVLIFTFLGISANAWAKFPESCFQSNFDYKIYLEYGDGQPIKPYDGMMVGPTKQGWMLDAWKHGPAKRKDITIKVNSSKVFGRIVLDASESKTPSGKIEFVWGSPEKPLSTQSSYSSGNANEFPFMSATLRDSPIKSAQAI